MIDLNEGRGREDKGEREELWQKQGEVKKF